MLITVEGRSTSQPSTERPDRRSRNAVTSAPITASSTANGVRTRSSTALACLVTRAVSAARSGIGATVSKLNRRLSAADISETPRSRRFAVAITVKPCAAGTVASAVPASSGTAILRSDRIDTRASCTSGRQRVISSIRATAPVRMAVSTGDGTSAAELGPFASSSA